MVTLYRYLITLNEMLYEILLHNIFNIETRKKLISFSEWSPQLREFISAFHGSTLFSEHLY